MSKITRKLMKIFGQNASAGSLGIGQFGSLAGGTPAYSKDPETIQGLSAWLSGWNAAVIGSNSPALEDFNALPYVFSYQLAYLMQQGIAEYNANTTYYTDSICQYAGVLYISATDSNTGNTPGGASAYWTTLIPSGGSGENLFRNAGFSVAQRGVGGTWSDTGEEKYTVDGWIMKSSYTPGVFSGAAIWTIEKYYGNILLIGNSSTSLQLGQVQLKQRISKENLDIHDFGITERMWTFQVTIYNESPAAITPTLTINEANADNDFSSTTNILPSKNLRTIMSLERHVCAYTVDLGFGSTHGLEFVIGIPEGLAAGGAERIGISRPSFSSTPGASVGVNNNPPAPQIRSYDQEIIDARRYYWQNKSQDVFLGAMVGSYFMGASSCVFPIRFPNGMFKIPTMTFDGTNFSVHGGSTTYGPSQLETYGTNILTNECCNFLLNGTTMPTIGQGLLLTLTADGALSFSAEL
jgi:hypothetical protein